jgi:hypothetical protein
MLPSGGAHHRRLHWAAEAILSRGFEIFDGTRSRLADKQNVHVARLVNPFSSVQRRPGPEDEGRIDTGEALREIDKLGSWPVRLQEQAAQLREIDARFVRTHDP